MQDPNALVSEIMELIDYGDGMSQALKAVLLGHARHLLLQGASLVPHILECVADDDLTLDGVTRWLDLGFDPNTILAEDPDSDSDDSCEPGPNTLLGHAAKAKNLKLIDMLCSRGARVTSDMYRGLPQAKYKGILCMHATKQVLVVLMGVIHPDLVGVLRGFML